MNKLTQTTLGAVALSAFLALPASAADCDAISSNISKAVASAPESVLSEVQNNVEASAECAADIVTTAITAADADAALVGEIVYTAVTVAPEQAASIAEAAISAAPEAEAEIKSGLKRAFEFSSKNPSYGKNPSYSKNPKQPEIVEPIEDEPALAPVDVRGIYLIPPVSPTGSLNFSGETLQEFIEEFAEANTTVVTVTNTVGGGTRIIEVEVSPSTGGGADLGGDDGTDVFEALSN